MFEEIKKVIPRQSLLVYPNVNKAFVTPSIVARCRSSMEGQVDLIGARVHNTRDIIVLDCYELA